VPPLLTEEAPLLVFQSLLRFPLRTIADGPIVDLVLKTDGILVGLVLSEHLVGCCLVKEVFHPKLAIAFRLDSHRPQVLICTDNECGFVLTYGGRPIAALLW
jgi:hypothetical protein